MSQQTALVTCAMCGAAAGDDLPLEWVSSVEDGHVRYYCRRCARDSLRAIEARLDPEWW